MENYHDLYLIDDVLVLAWMVETFTKEFMNSSQLDPDHYLSTPCYSWYAMLRFTVLNLELKLDI